MMISLALNDVYVTLHSENSTEHSHCGWPGKCLLFVCLFVCLFFVSISNVKSQHFFEAADHAI